MTSRALAISLLLVSVLGAAGCSLSDRPRPRLGHLPCPIIGTTYLDPDNLGMHGYRFGLGEKNGTVYTCKAGHIDISHLRIAADWTRFLANKTFEHLQRNDTAFTFKLNVEPSVYFVQVTYPKDWNTLLQKDKERLAHLVSVKLGQYFAFTAVSWHEILTWFGFKCTGLIPEFSSAFSWEDSFSNLLGSHIAANVLLDNPLDFDLSMTLAIDQELRELGIQSAAIAAYAAEKMRGKWFSGQVGFSVDMKKRNFDIGVDDGYITPTLVPSLYTCDGVKPQPYPVPDLKSLSEYGFSVRLEIEPREWEKSEILRIVYPDPGQRRNRIEPAIHFARIIEYIKEDAVKRLGYDVSSVDSNDVLK